MPTLPVVQGHPTLVNWAKTFDPTGKAYRAAQLLSQSNQLLDFLTWKEGNLATGHKDAVQVGLPTPVLRRFYKGVPPSKDDTAIVEDVCAMQEMRSEVDKDIAELGGNVTAYRQSKAIPFMEGMYQFAAQQFIYGDTATNKDGILGLTPRYNNIANVGSTVFNTAANIIDSGGTGSNNTSVWLLVSGDETVSGIFPKGSKAGIQHEDLGIYDAFDNQTPAGRYRAYGEWWQWKYGLHVKDWRYIVRVANINVADLQARTGTQANGVATSLLYTMIDALARIPSEGMGTPMFLASRLVKAKLSQMALDKSQNALGFTEAVNQFGTVGAGSVAGGGQGMTNIKGRTLLFQGVPVLTVDKIIAAEARVV